MDHPPATDQQATGFSEAKQFRQMQLRGMGTASFCLGFLGSALFWEFPHGATIATVGLILGVFCLLRGEKGSSEGDPLTLVGVGLCSMAIFAALFTRLIGMYGVFDSL